MRKIYLASSWRNPLQPEIVALLRRVGHEVYDFRNPPNGDAGFSWREIDDNWKDWTPTQYREALNHPASVRGLQNDFAGMQWADTCVALAPFGRSASLELGWAIGAGKKTAVLLAPGEPELMFGLADALLVEPQELVVWLSGLRLES